MVDPLAGPEVVPEMRRAGEPGVVVLEIEAGRDGEVGRLDFDPYIDGQDYQITDLKFGDAQITGDTAKVEVTFKNFDLAEDLTFTLVKEAGGWKVDDVSSANKDFPYSLKAIMEAPLAPVAQ